MYGHTQSNFEAQKFLSSLEPICTHVCAYAAQFDWNSTMKGAQFRDSKRFVRMYARTQSNYEAQKFLSSLEPICMHVRMYVAQFDWNSTLQ